ncbi:MAG: zinc transporter ZupT [Clostridia bacterium]|nr:zinc transporter ZupT [Clostridia bacterium]
MLRENVIFALFVTVMAGLATGFGSIISVFTKGNNTKFLSFSLGFSAGVMIYVSMVEIFSKSRTYLEINFTERGAALVAGAAFFAGILFIGLIDFIVPSAEGDIGNLHNKEKNNNLLKRMGIMTALAIAIHNFPEGLATFTASLKDPHLGVAIAVAIAIHNIPEGIATAIPIYYSTNSKRKAFKISFLSGMTEPLGAIIGYLLLRPIFNDTVFGILFGFIAGIMVFISIEELLPLAREYEKSKATIIGFVFGMMIMAASLILFI